MAWSGQAVYDGNFINDKRTGLGIMRWPDGTSYEGDFVDGRRTGQGVYLWKNGKRYEGGFIDGKRTGQGIMTWPNGERYEGNFVKGYRTGQGVYLWKDGTRYEGDFVNDKRTGQGIMTWPSGNHYKGDFVRNKRTGKGVFLWKNGKHYKGDFVNNERTGLGIMTWLNGVRYEGTFLDGKMSDQAKAYQQAFEWNSIEAEHGDRRAQYKLGQIYFKGHGVTQNYKLAFSWYSKAAGQKYAKAQYNLGQIYFEGYGITQDYNLAFSWYSKAAEQGHSEAQEIVGYMYEKGYGVTRDYKKSFEWYSKAAKQDNERAKGKLDGIEDYIQILEWYNKALEITEGKLPLLLLGLLAFALVMVKVIPKSIPEEIPEGIVKIPFQFTGNTFEYFRIWIVNLSLIILTLGIYSAWAKVRNKRYFYANTYIDGTPFDYLAKPIYILKGRILLFMGFLIFIPFFYVSQWAILLFFPIMILISPWLVIIALRFNASNSAYRNISFSFKATMPDGRKVYWWGWLGTVMSFGLSYPFFAWQRQKFRINNSQFGTSLFSFHLPNSYKYYRLYVGALFFSFFIGLFFTLLALFSSTYLGQFTKEISATFYALFYYVYVKVGLTNIFYNNTKLGEHRFISTLKVLPLFWIYLSNTLAITFSFGLLLPWAKIRTMHYRADCLQLLVDGNLSGFIGEEQQRSTAIFEEVGEFVDMDLGL